MSTDVKDLTRLKHKSGVVSLGPDRAPARSMLRAVGLNDDDMEKPFIGVANFEYSLFCIRCDKIV